MRVKQGGERAEPGSDEGGWVGHVWERGVIGSSSSRIETLSHGNFAGPGLNRPLRAWEVRK